MIEWAKIERFRAIRSAEFTLEPLTFFLGPNGSGKTTILDALDATQDYRRSDYWRHEGTPPALSLRMQVNGHKRRGPRAPDWYRYQALRLDLNRMRDPNQLQAVHSLEPNGSNLANLFDTLSRRERETLVAQYCRLVPTFSDVDRIATTPGAHTLRFQDAWNPNVWYQPPEVSDGSILVLAFLLLQYQRPQVDVVAIEEPERGLHPYLLEQLVDFLRTLSMGKLGDKPVQILLATHSPQLVEFAQPKEVRFVDRDPKSGDVSVRTPPTEEAQWEAAFAEYKQSLGAVWLSGALGGVPGA